MNTLDIDLRAMPTYTDRALCGPDRRPPGWGAESFFPASEKDAGHAKALCRPCPARRDCLEYALEHQINDGVWGGFSTRERRRIRRMRGAA